jgi:hypothetical protein
MNTGLELIYNGTLQAAVSSVENQWTVLGISALEDKDNISISFQRLKMSNDKNSTVFYYSKIALHDIIRIKVKEIETVIEPSCNYANYVNFIRLQRYNYLHKVIHNRIETDNSTGLKIRVNDRIITVLLLKNRNMGFVINQNKNGINLNIGATDKVSDILFKDKCLLQSSLCLGDEISIELTSLKEDTPSVSEYEYEVEKPMTLEKIRAEYYSLQTQLAKEGLLKHNF